jgi:beta-galactosidase
MKPTKNHGPLGPKVTRMLHGADYNPEQWMDLPGIWDADVRLMKLSESNVMSVGIFSWATYEPAEGEYHLDWMGRVLDLLHENGVQAVLATPSGAKPAWLGQKYPETRRVNAQGVREEHGARHNHCPTSPVYRDKIVALNTKLAERFGRHPAVVLWHVSNEYSGECFCGLCKARFREWLEQRYGSLDALNRAWWSSFWSHRFGRWEEIDSLDGSMHGMKLDWRRFTTDQHIEFFRAESAPLRRITPEIPLTVNMMGTYPGIDYFKFAPHLDVISWDSYPAWHEHESDAGPGAHAAFVHDLNRSLKNRPFMLMESTPSQQNWQTICRAKRPGMHLLSSLQAVAHGSDTVQYFQWRKSRGSCEKFHGAVVDHAGHEHTRVFRDVTDVGLALAKLDAVVGTSVAPEVAVLYDWENRWAIDESIGPRNRHKDYEQTVVSHYREFWRRGIAADVVNEDGDFSGYRLLVAPMLYMLRPGVARRIAEFVRAGGTFVTTYLSGIANESDLCFLGGFPGEELRQVLGIWVEETDVMHDHQTQTLLAVGGNAHGLSGEYSAHHYADVVHLEGARALCTYGREYYAGSPAATANEFGNGRAYYLGARTDERFLGDFYRSLATRLELGRVLDGELPDGVSVTERGDEQHRFVFVMNFTPDAKRVSLGGGSYQSLLRSLPASGILELGPYGVDVLQAR